MTKQIPRIKLTLTQGDVDVIKKGNKLSPTVKLEFEKKGEVNLNYCIVQLDWYDYL